jgi:hypothetical protein
MRAQQLNTASAGLFRLQNGTGRGVATTAVGGPDWGSAWPPLRRYGEPNSRPSRGRPVREGRLLHRGRHLAYYHHLADTLVLAAAKPIDSRGDPRPMAHGETLAQALRARIETLKAIRDPDEETLGDLAIIEESLKRLEERQRLEERDPAWARATGKTLH